MITKKPRMFMIPTLRERSRNDGILTQGRNENDNLLKMMAESPCLTRVNKA